ncbi:MAG: ABC transporter permease [Anaerolineae bacterium]|nr:ABC transporter permease [Anaerolineae bacterium]
MLTNSPPLRVISAQRDNAREYLNPVAMLRSLWRYRELIGQFTKRQVLARYKGSYLGLVWSFATPLATLLVYTFVFSVVFKARWEGAVTDSHGEFALALFAGLIAFNIFSETTLTAPHMVVGNPNYVKKVVFPLEILPVATLGSAVIHSFFSLSILLVGTLLILGRLPWTLVYLPLMYLPLILLCLGISWFFASLGVFIRDIGHLLGVAVQMLFFLTPIFYPISAIPENFRAYIYLNPLTFIVNHFRRVALFGQSPDWGEFVLFTLGALLVCLAGYVWFMKSKKTFADVV